MPLIVHAVPPGYVQRRGFVMYILQGSRLYRVVSLNDHVSWSENDTL